MAHTADGKAHWLVDFAATSLADDQARAVWLEQLRRVHAGRR